MPKVIDLKEVYNRRREQANKERFDRAAQIGIHKMVSEDVIQVGSHTFEMSGPEIGYRYPTHGEYMHAGLSRRPINGNLSLKIRTGRFTRSDDVYATPEWEKVDLDVELPLQMPAQTIKIVVGRFLGMLGDPENGVMLVNDRERIQIAIMEAVKHFRRKLPEANPKETQYFDGLKQFEELAKMIYDIKEDCMCISGKSHNVDQMPLPEFALVFSEEYATISRIAAIISLSIVENGLLHLNARSLGDGEFGSYLVTDGVYPDAEKLLLLIGREASISVRGP